MIQRLQSLFLLLAAVCFGLEYSLPFAASDQSAGDLFSDKIYNAQDHISLQVLVFAGTALCLLSIFLYKKRNLQIRISYLAMTLSIVMIIIAVLLYTNQAPTIGDAEISDGAGLYIPILIITFISLGIRWIKKDDKLVKSMDRLR